MYQHTGRAIGQIVWRRGLTIIAASLAAVTLVACGYGRDLGSARNAPRFITRTAPSEHATASVMSAATRGNTKAAVDSTFVITPLKNDLRVPNTIPRTQVVYALLKLNPGELRRVGDRIEFTISRTKPAEVDNGIKCSFLDGNGVFEDLPNPVSSGTNHQGSAAGWLVLRNSLLLQATNGGVYRCEANTYTSDTSVGYSAYYETVASIDSFLQISATNEIGAQEWTHDLCNSAGKVSTCEYLGDKGDPTETYLVPQLLVPPPTDPSSPNLWTAANDATEVDLLGTFQWTSCPHNTASCTSAHRGPGTWFGGSADKNAQITSFMEFDQLYPDGTVCRSNVSNDPDNAGNLYDISNSVHHLPVVYADTVSVSPNCRGSRTFDLKIYVKWFNGNPVKVDGGKITAINSAHAASTATVPNVLGVGRDQAVATLVANGFAVPIINSVANPAATGTVIDQNAPGGTLEPTGSPVNLTLSLGGGTPPGLTAPNVVGQSETQARAMIAAAGLTVGSVSNPNTCIDPGLVSQQHPSAGAPVAAGALVNLVVPICKGGPVK